MIFKAILFLICLLPGSLTFAKASDRYQDVKMKDVKTNKEEVFSDSEANFRTVMKTLLDRYVDKNLTKDELYRAATAGMLASLNSEEEAWNKLISPSELKEMQVELSGKVTGVGVEMKFDEKSGYATILRVIPKSAAEKAGIKPDDQVLSVDGKKFKGKQFPDLVSAVRGEVGKSVEMKVLREDKIMTFDLKREVVPWTPVELETMSDGKTALLKIGFFNEETPKMVEKDIEVINQKGVKDLIVDIRDNSGGGFDQAVKVSELFLEKGAVIVSTKDREGKVETFKSSRGVLNPGVKIFVLTDKETSSGAEFFAAALRENKAAKIIGEKTLGKWNAQMVETLPNRFAIKYTVKEFQSPNGNSFQGKGLKPDVEVSLPQGAISRELRLKRDIQNRLEADAQLKAAVEFSKMN